MQSDRRRRDRSNGIGLGLSACAAFIAVGALPSVLRGNPPEPVAGVSQPGDRSTVVDAFGDPLPAGALMRYGTIRFRTPSPVVGMSLSPDDSTLVTIGREMVVWDAATGKERWRVDGKLANPFNRGIFQRGQGPLAFSRDSSRCFTPGNPDGILIWKLGTEKVQELSIQRSENDRIQIGYLLGLFRSLDVSADGKLFALGSRKGVAVCDDAGQLQYEIGQPLLKTFTFMDRLGTVYQLGVFSPDGATLAFATVERPQEIEFYESKTGKLLRKLSLESVLVSFAFSPDSKQLATTERDNAVRYYDVNSSRQIWSRVIPLNGGPNAYTSAVAISPDGKWVAAGATDSKVHLLAAANGDEEATFGEHWGHSWALAFSRNGQKLYSAGLDSAIHVWDVASRQSVWPVDELRETLNFALAPDERILAIQDDAGAVRLFEPPGKSPVRTLQIPDAQYFDLSFSADGRFLAGGGMQHEQAVVAVWDVNRGEVVRRWELPKVETAASAVASVRFSPDGKRLVASVVPKSAVYVWEFDRDEHVHQFPHDQLIGMTLSPDGKTIVTIGRDAVIRFWDMESGMTFRELTVKDLIKGNSPGIDDICYSPEGDFLATTHNDGMTRIWQADGMRLRFQFRASENSGARTIRFSPDGLWLACGTDSAVWLIDPSTGESVWNASAHRYFVTRVEFGRDSRKLASRGHEAVTYLWDLTPTDGTRQDDLNRLWNDVVGDESRSAYRAIWRLTDIPDRAIPLIADKLSKVTTAIDPDYIGENQSTDEVEKDRQEKRRMIRENANMAAVKTIKRATAVLSQIGTPEAVETLNELVRRDSNGAIRRIAENSLKRMPVPRK